MSNIPTALNQKGLQWLEGIGPYSRQRYQGDGPTLVTATNSSDDPSVPFRYPNDRERGK